MKTRAERNAQIRAKTVKFRWGNKGRSYALMHDNPGDPIWTFRTHYERMIREDTWPVIGIAAVQFIVCINYTFLKIRRNWYRTDLNLYARRRHVSQINVLWINGSISRAECVDAVKNAYRVKYRPRIASAAPLDAL